MGFYRAGHSRPIPAPGVEPEQKQGGNITEHDLKEQV